MMTPQDPDFWDPETGNGKGILVWSNINEPGWSWKNGGVLKNTSVYHHIETNEPHGRLVFLVSREKNKLVANSNNFFLYKI